MKLRLLPVAALGVTASYANADIFEFNFPIETSQEVTTPDISGFTPSGTGFVTLDTDTNELTWQIDYQGLTGEIVAPGAHFHGAAGFGQNAGIQVFLSDGNPPEPATGTLAGSTTISDSQEADVLAGLWYVNIHTARNPSGEIRGQVVPAPAGGMLLAAGTLLAARRRR